MLPCRRAARSRRHHILPPNAYRGAQDNHISRSVCPQFCEAQIINYVYRHHAGNAKKGKWTPEDDEVLTG